MGLEKNSVSDIRAALVRAGLSVEEAAEVKGKANLAAKLIELLPEGTDVSSFVNDDVNEQLEEVDFNKVEMESDLVEAVADVEAENQANAEAIVERRVPPGRNETGWHDWVMKQFAEDELDNGNPKVAGLRRLVNKLVGRVVFTGPVELKTVLGENGLPQASCVYRVDVREFEDAGNYVDLDDPKFDVCTYRAAAGSFHGNTDDEFAAFPEAMAETRAESRALKKALGLKVVGSDELTSKDTAEEVRKALVPKGFDAAPVEPEYNPDAPIKAMQKKHIESQCKKLGIDVLKFINLGDTKYESLDDVSTSTASKMFGVLNQYQSETGDKESRKIPKDILIGD